MLGEASLSQRKQKQKEKVRLKEIKFLRSHSIMGTICTFQLYPEPY